MSDRRTASLQLTDNRLTANTLWAVWQTLKKLQKADSVFLGSGLVVALLAALFALLFSHDLVGPENRGVISVIFLAEVTYFTVTLGGLNISFRSHRGSIHPSKYGNAFVQISVFASLLASVMVVATSIAYSHFKNEVAYPLILLSGFYAFLATLQNQLFQSLLSLHQIRARWKMDLFVVTSQILIYEFLKTLNLFSVAVTILLAFSTSYLVAIFLIFFKRKKLGLVVNFKQKQIANIVQLFRDSAANYTYSIVSALVDKIDRILVLLLFSTGTFGKYALLTGILSFARFLPDAVSNLVVAKRMHWIEEHLKVDSTRRTSIILILAVIYALVAQETISLIFGARWHLPFAVALLCSLTEVMRAFYTTKMSFLFDDTKSNLPSKTATMILLTATVVPLLIRPFLSVTAVPAGLLFAYVATFAYFQIFSRKNDMRSKEQG